eukprot:5559710-Heterocapsa_arctica.AAC.1
MRAARGDRPGCRRAVDGQPPGANGPFLPVGMDRRPGVPIDRVPWVWAETGEPDKGPISQPA